MTWLAVVQTLAGHRHERRIVLLALAVLTALAWIYLWRAPMPMPAANGGLRTPEYAALTFAMWFVMMVGMMTPAAARAVAVRSHRARSTRHLATARTHCSCSVTRWCGRCTRWRRRCCRSADRSG
jgi:predicted metal-binding membrane protein